MLRLSLFERRHAQHRIRGWSRAHADSLQCNGPYPGYILTELNRPLVENAELDLPRPASPTTSA